MKKIIIILSHQISPEIQNVAAGDFSLNLIDIYEDVFKRLTLL